MLPECQEGLRAECRQQSGACMGLDMPAEGNKHSVTSCPQSSCQAGACSSRQSPCAVWLLAVGRQQMTGLMLDTALQVTVSDSNFVSNFGRQTGVIQMMGNSSQLSVSNSLFYNNTGEIPGSHMQPEGSCMGECSNVAVAGSSPPRGGSSCWLVPTALRRRLLVEMCLCSGHLVEAAAGHQRLGTPTLRGHQCSLQV